MKNNEIFPPNGNFSNHIGSMECKGLITAKNSTLEFKTGPVEFEIMTKNDQNDKTLQNKKKLIY